MNLRKMIVGWMILSFAVTTCLADEVANESDGKPDKEKVSPVKEAKLPGTRNVHIAGNVYLAGQPSEEALQWLAKKKVKTVITLRHPAEERWDEAAVCKRLGLEFVRLQVSSPDDLNDELFGRVREILKKASPENGVLFHCASANRVGAVWMAHRVKDAGMSLEAARKEAAEVGLRTRELEDKAIEYLKK